MNDIYFRIEKELNGRSRHNLPGVSTHAERTTWPVEQLEVYYHWTPVVTARSDGSVKLHTNGWQTVTTKERINRYLNIVKWTVTQHNYDWYVVSPEGDVYDFYSGMTIWPDENRIEYEDRSVTISEQAKKLSKKWKEARAKYQAYNQQMHAQPMVYTDKEDTDHKVIHVRAQWESADDVINSIMDIAAARQAMHDKGEV